MAITGVGSSYNHVYESTYTTQKSLDMPEKTSTTRENAETNSETRKTAMDELTYLSDKYTNCTFVAMDYKMGMRYGRI